MVPSMVSFVNWQSASSSVEAKVLIEPILASSGVIASSPNRSLNGVNPVDLDVVIPHVLLYVNNEYGRKYENINKNNSLSVLICFVCREFDIVSVFIHPGSS
jgi:hypothetical protein